jgi:hypothetical protein
MVHTPLRVKGIDALSTHLTLDSRSRLPGRWHCVRVRRLVLLGAVCGLFLSACGGSTDGKAPRASYLGTDATAVTFLRWTETESELTGTARFAIETDPTTGTVEFTDYELTGRRSGNQVTLTIKGLPGGPWEGRVRRSSIDLRIPQSDGTIQPFTFEHASIPDYNRAVARLRDHARKDAQGVD